MVQIAPQIGIMTGGQTDAQRRIEHPAGQAGNPPTRRLGA
jgi:hypothetical protein